MARRRNVAESSERRDLPSADGLSAGTTEPPEVTGLRCPRCACPHSEVVRTVNLRVGRVRRYRTCTNCERSFRTREQRS